MKIYPDFRVAIEQTAFALKTRSYDVHTHTWQGYKIAERPEAAMREILNWSFQVPMPGTNMHPYRSQIEPNLPWADDHFDERVCGQPLNPGETWKKWPWALKADESRRFGEKFSHTYMERYWPPLTQGLRFMYGDLGKVVELFHRDPLTRQGYLPVWFPEDTGATHNDRVPCTLGYHWILRGSHLHTFYPIRSCDFYRHFRDDLYLTSRLTLWLLYQLNQLAPEVWGQVKPGFFTFWCGSLHLFINDFHKLFGENDAPRT